MLEKDYGSDPAVRLSAVKRSLLQKRLRGKSIETNRVTPMSRRSVDGPHALSFAQQRLWFLHQMDPDSQAYIISFSYRLRGSLDVEVFKRSLNEIVRRHEALRTTFLTVNGEPTQVITSSVEMPISHIDIEGLSESEKEKKVHRVVSGESLKNLDLSIGPVIRAILLRSGTTEHFFIIVVHHIAFDGWSAGVFLHELRALYGAFSAGKPSPLPELPIQYADFAHWQREWLQGEVLEEQLEYWKQQLGGNIPVLKLPTDRPRPAVQTYRGATESFVLSERIKKGLKKLSQREGITLFMTLLAAFHTLLYRYTGQEGFAIGTPIANRNRSEIENLIGFFVNTLVLKNDISGDPSFKKLLGRVRGVTLGAYDHQDLPFERLVEELQPVRDMSNSPLFQVMFVLQNVPMEPGEFPGLTMTPLEIETNASMFDLSLYMQEREEGLSGTFEYNTDLFDGATIVRMATHFERLLESIVSDAGQRLSELSLLTIAEHHKLLVEWNDTVAEFHRDRCIHELFEDQVAKTPDRVSVTAGKNQLTFAELNQRANDLAYYLGQMNVGPGALVALCLERSLEAYIAMLGVLKSGAAYLPLDPTYPMQSLGFMLQDSRSAVLIASSHTQDVLPEFEGHVIYLDRDWHGIIGEIDQNPVCKVKADDPAYVIYTSGSTGKPKGVIGLHRGSVNRFRWMWKNYPFKKTNEVCCQKTALNFVDSIWEIFGPLLQGIPSVILSDDEVKHPMRFVEVLRRHKVTRLVLVPSLLRVLLESIDDIEFQVPMLKLWICSGEVLQVELARRFQQKLPESTLLNLYGSSEVAADVTSFDTRQLLPEHERTPIGRPIDNTQIYIMDKKCQLVPIGVVGEIYVGGIGIASGYCNQPELTSERFVTIRIKGKGNTNLFKTGDLGRYFDDGNIDYIGRVDHQVKIRGFRVELGEVEATLRQHHTVKDAAMNTLEVHSGEIELTAYLVPKSNLQIDVEKLRRWLQKYLPAYMVPSRFKIMESLPLTVSGKVDRKSLPEIGNEKPISTKTPFAAAKDPLELQLVQIWESVLKIKPIGIKDNFFEIGGHSLQAARIFAKIEKLMGINLPLSTLFQEPAIELIAKIIRDKNRKLPWASLIPIQAGGSKPPLFFVHGAGGNVLLYRELALHLGGDQPFYGLQAQGLDGKEPFLSSFCEMATRYIDEMRSLQPDGPYYLGGYCLGGSIALEMAQQLSGQGREIALLAMIETYNFNSENSTLPFYYDVFYPLQNLKFHWDNFCALGMRDKMAFLLKKARTQLERMKLSVGIVFSQTMRKLHIPIGEKYPHINLTKINDQINMEYIPKSYNGKIILFRPKKHYAGYSKEDFGWGEVAQGGVDIHTLPVNPRGSLIEPYVQELAREIKKCIRLA